MPALVQACSISNATRHVWDPFLLRPTCPRPRGHGTPEAVTRSDLYGNGQSRAVNAYPRFPGLTPICQTAASPIQVARTNKSVPGVCSGGIGKPFGLAPATLPFLFMLSRAPYKRAAPPHREFDRVPGFRPGGRDAALNMGRSWIRRRSGRRVEEPDAGNPQVRFREGP
jgi:hypothetical protein